jgi:hypothetical protein
VLAALSNHINTVRHSKPAIAEKLSAAEASCVHIKTLETLEGSWRATFRDLRSSVRRMRAHLKLLAKGKRRLASRG